MVLAHGVLKQNNLKKKKKVTASLILSHQQLMIFCQFRKTSNLTEQKAGDTPGEPD